MLTKLKLVNNNPAVIQKPIKDAPDCFALFPNTEHPNFRGLNGFSENTLLFFANQIEDGIFETSSYSFHYYIEDCSEWKTVDKSTLFKNGNIFNCKPDNDSNEIACWDGVLTVYGVADNLDQIKNYFKDVINNPNVNFAISFVRLKKENEPKKGGWRWHKWGEYIGMQNPQCEYLADEPEIEEVLVFHGHFIQKSLLAFYTEADNKSINDNLPDYDEFPHNGIYY